MPLRRGGLDAAWTCAGMGADTRDLLDQRSAFVQEKIPECGRNRGQALAAAVNEIPLEHLRETLHIQDHQVAHAMWTLGIAAN